MTDVKNTTESEKVRNTSSTANQVIDIERLAEKVYQLLCKEIRMDRARGDVRRLRS
jgi:hypothetical protein